MSDIDGDTELIEDFVVESRASLDVVDRALLTLESIPSDVSRFLIRATPATVHQTSAG